MEKHGHITLLTVFNPWQGARGVAYHYVLCPKGTVVPDEYAAYPVIYTPVERVVCLSTTHVAMLSYLDKMSSVKGLAGTNYLYDTTVLKAIADKKIVDIGYDQALNYERIISLKPDVVFAYGIEEGIAGSLARLSDLGLTVVLNAEYLEQTALGKTEWLKFMAAFYQCEDQAEHQFDEIAKEYNDLCEMVKEVSAKPKVLLGLPWQGTWYIPGGKSFIAEMITHAGGSYLWSDNESRESLPIHIEAIMNKAGDADLWINTGTARSLSDIPLVDERLAHLLPYKKGLVFNNYARISSGGGNDFFESGVVQPQVILKDMIKIFHPDLLPDHELYYYMQLQ